MKQVRRLFPIAVVATIVGAVMGCSRKQRNEDFTPAEDVARSSLEAYFQAWVHGDLSIAVPNTHPEVMIADNLRSKGRTLTGYKILGPVPADAPWCFAVQLSLGNPVEDVRERYVVVGMDPIWVWRYEDYIMITHWSHNMPADQKSAPPAKK